MRSRWNDADAPPASDPLALRVYSSRLLGADPDLVLHGGGNTSVKTGARDFFGEAVEVLHVKGSGWDLATIEAAGFAPVRLGALRRLATRPDLDDREIVRQQRLALLDPEAPDPSVEAILHAVIPRRYVDHTHADAVVTLTNTPDADATVREVYGDRLLVVPYVMPGFTLARRVFELTRDADWSALDGLLLMNHGLFTFADDARASYEAMLELVTLAEAHLERRGAPTPALEDGDPGNDDPDAGGADPVRLAALRRHVSRAAGRPLVARWDAAPATRALAGRSDLADVAGRGPLTPDHVIRTKPLPLVTGESDDPETAVAAYADAYRAYFERHAEGHADDPTMLDPAPRWALLAGHGALCFGASAGAAATVRDIGRHTARAITQAEALGGWRALPEADLFDVEYWSLEQAKLARGGAAPPLQGRVALVTGAASGIGRASADALAAAGAAVVGLDLDAAVEARSGDAALGLRCDVTDTGAVERAVERAVRTFGGIDILVGNAGIFPPSRTLAELTDDEFARSLAVNLDAHRKVLRACLPFLERGWNPSVVLIASRNVPAPGPGAAAYSAAKAGLTQLGRVAALELAPAGVRVNILHPDAVYDTGIWNDALIRQRAESYGLSVEAYRRKSLLGREITSEHVAAAVVAFAGDTFARTTGAQIPVDGGNARVI